MLEEDDGLRPAAGIGLGCLLGAIAWLLIVGGSLLLVAVLVLLVAG